MKRIALLLVLASCSADSVNSALGIDPAAASVPPAALVQFAALGAPPPLVWTVVESGGGTVSGAGLYTAPACPTTGVFHVQVSVGGQTAQAAVTVAEAVRSVTVAPSTGTVEPGGTVQFTATVASTCGTTTTSAALRAPAATR